MIDPNTDKLLAVFFFVWVDDGHARQGFAARADDLASPHTSANAHSRPVRAALADRVYRRMDFDA